MPGGDILTSKWTIVVVGFTALVATAAIPYWADIGGRGGHEESPPEHQVPVVRHPVVQGAVLFTEQVLRYSWARPLEDPQWIRASDEDFMRDEDLVIAFIRGENAYAIPWWILKNHHVANLEIEGQAISIAFCENCSSAVGFAPRIDGQVLELTLVGLYNGSILVADRQTGTLWAPFSGEGIHGTYAGRKLPRFPLYLSTWEDWVRRHPSTRVAWREEESRGGHGETSGPGEGPVGSRMQRTLKRALDARIRPNVMVAGVALDDAALAIPLSVFEESGPIVRVRLGDFDVTIYNEPDSYLVAAFASPADRPGVELRVDEAGRLRDAGTGSTWDLQGRAVEGPLRGQTLTAIPVNVEEWYIWAAYHPETGIYQRFARSPVNR